MVLNDFEKGFLVGLIEGEGSIFINRRVDKRVGRSLNGFTLCPCVDVTNTDFQLISFYESIVKKIMSVESYRTKIATNLGNLNLVEAAKRGEGKWSVKWKIGYRVRIHDKQTIISLFREIGDLLVSKKERAKLLLEWCCSRKANLLKFRRQAYTEREKELYNILHVANKRGVG